VLTIPDPVQHHAADALSTATTRQQLCEQLQALAAQERSSSDAMTDLAQLVLLGVAFYSSAVPKPARDLVERGMKAGEWVFQSCEPHFVFAIKVVRMYLALHGLSC
jgi:hypothetical protein